jgi:excisionase family DNA binding protein
VIVEEFFTYDELVARLRVSKRYATARVMAGEWPCHRFGARVRFTESDVAEIIARAARPAGVEACDSSSGPRPISRIEMGARVRAVKNARREGRAVV